MYFLSARYCKLLAPIDNLSYFIDSMKIKQTILVAVATLGLAVGIVAFSQTTYALEKCGGVETSIISCDQGNSDGGKDNGVWGLLLLTLNIMTAGVGILAVGGIAYGAALYASSGDKPEQAKQGKQYIQNVIIGLVAYGLMFLLLNFLIPGGIFDSGGGPQNGTPGGGGPSKAI